MIRVTDLSGRTRVCSLVELPALLAAAAGHALRVEVIG